MNTKLTKKGRELMTAIGNAELSFFDDGVVEGSGSYGEVIAGDFGFANPRSAAGVLGGLVKQGLMTADEAEGDAGLWYSLTALGADVANSLADSKVPADAEPVDTRTVAEQEQEASVLTIKTGRKWTYLYNAAGELVAEIRNDVWGTQIAHLVD